MRTRRTAPPDQPAADPSSIRSPAPTGQNESAITVGFNTEFSTKSGAKRTLGKGYVRKRQRGNRAPARCNGGSHTSKLEVRTCCEFDAVGKKRQWCYAFLSPADGPKFIPPLASQQYSVAVVGRGVSFQITVLKVLAGHPEGCASLADLKLYVAVLTCSGADWSQRMKRLAARAPGLDIFSSRYVLREPGGWQITQQGRDFLASIEAPSAEPAVSPVASPPPVGFDSTQLPTNIIQLAGHKVQRRGRRAAA